MASPFRKDQLSPAMAERYGLNARPWGTWLIASGVVIAFIAALVFVGIGITRSTGGSELLAWQAHGQDRVTVTFAIRREEGQPLQCAVRGQDGTHVDVGYAIVDVPAGPASAQQVVELRTISPARSVEVLGCDLPGSLNVIDPQFPPGVVPPEQPWTPAS